MFEIPGNQILLNTLNKVKHESKKCPSLFTYLSTSTSYCRKKDIDMKTSNTRLSINRKII